MAILIWYVALCRMNDLMLMLKSTCHITINKLHILHQMGNFVIFYDSYSNWQNYTYLFSGCVQGCIIPFISRYKLSNSISLGFGWLASTGTVTPSITLPWKIIVRPLVRHFWLRYGQKRQETQYLGLGLNLFVRYLLYSMPEEKVKCHHDYFITIIRDPRRTESEKNL